MDLHEAHEVMISPDKITVVYKGEPVWIEEVENNTETAQVRVLKNSKSNGSLFKRISKYKRNSRESQSLILGVTYLYVYKKRCLRI
jgi:Small acid-soluble spore protein H family.